MKRLLVFTFLWATMIFFANGVAALTTATDVVESRGTLINATQVFVVVLIKDVASSGNVMTVELDPGQAQEVSLFLGRTYKIAFMAITEKEGKLFSHNLGVYHETLRERFWTIRVDILPEKSEKEKILEI